LNFTGVSAINVIGTPGDDQLQITGAIAPPITFASGNGNDSLHVFAGGSGTIAADLSPSLKNVAVAVDSGGAIALGATQHLASLAVDGSATLNAGGSRVLVTKLLTLGANGTLDLGDNDLVLDYADTSPVGSWTGSAYSGITGLIASGRNGGSWNGKGIITTSAGTSGLKTLGIAEASLALGATGGTFGTETVDGSAILVKFTYAGDATLNGKIDVADYGRVDFNAPLSSSGWFNGDFNYDGKVDIGDYGVIDFNLPIQGAVL
jgi:hypothetical protein